MKRLRALVAALMATGGLTAIALTTSAPAGASATTVPCTISMTGSAPTSADESLSGSSTYNINKNNGIGYTLTCSPTTTTSYPHYTVMIPYGSFEMYIEIDNPLTTTATYEVSSATNWDDPSSQPNGTDECTTTSSVICQAVGVMNPGTNSNMQPYYSLHSDYGGGGSADIIGTVTVSEDFGNPPPCTPLAPITATNGTIYNATATGTSSYSFTGTYVGPIVEVVADPDDDTNTQTIHGQAFGEDATVDSSPDNSGTETISVTPLRGSDPNNTTLWCWDGFTWTTWGTVFSGGSGTPPSATGCQLTTIVGPSSFYTPGMVAGDGQAGTPSGITGYTNYVYSITTVTSSNTYMILVDPNDDPGGTPYSPPDTGSTTFPSDSVFFTNPAAVQTMTVPIKNGSSVNPIFWCYKTTLSGGSWVDWGNYTADGVNPSGGACNTFCPPAASSGSTDNSGSGGNGFSLSECYANAATTFSWNIIADALDFAKGTLALTNCLLQYLFIPGSINFATESGNLQERIPFVYVTDAVNAVQTLNSGLSSAIATGACSPPTISPFSEESTGILSRLNWTISMPAPTDLGCTNNVENADAGNLFGARDFIRTVLTIGIWASTAGIIWKMLPWARPGDPVDIISAFAAPGDGGNLIPTFQTNEGSDEPDADWWDEH